MIDGMRELLTGFACNPDYLQAIYVRKVEYTVSYNGAFYTVFLAYGVPAPRPNGVPAILMSESNKIRVWKIDYPFDQHCKRLTKASSDE